MGNHKNKRTPAAERKFSEAEAQAQQMLNEMEQQQRADQMRQFALQAAINQPHVVEQINLYQVALFDPDDEGVRQLSIATLDGKRRDLLLSPTMAHALAENIISSSSERAQADKDALHRDYSDLFDLADELCSSQAGQPRQEATSRLRAFLQVRKSLASRVVPGEPTQTATTGDLEPTETAVTGNNEPVED